MLPAWGISMNKDREVHVTAHDRVTWAVGTAGGEHGGKFILIQFWGPPKLPGKAGHTWDGGTSERSAL